MSTTPMTAAQWRSQLRKFGQPFVEKSTFADPTSGRDGETGLKFGPVYGGLIHHTGDDAPDSADSRVIADGRSDLPGPLAHAGARDDGVLELFTTGRANHAGKGDADVLAALRSEDYGAYPPRPDFDSIDGNDALYGLEMYYSGLHAPTAEQYRAAVNWAAAFCDFHGWSAKSGIGHKEWTRRKIDPGRIDMAEFRHDVDARIAAVNAPAPVESHPRWAVRTTGVYETPGGTKLRDIPAGYKFQVVDGSGHGNDGWVETSAGNWVLAADTTTRDPALPFRLSVMTRNVKVNRSWIEEVLPETNRMLAKHVTHVAALQECYDAPDLAGMVAGYAYRYQGYGYEPKTPGYIEERSDNVILVRDGTEVKARQAYEMDLSWKGPVLGAWHDPRVLRRVTVEEDGQTWRVVNVHGPFGAAPKAEFLTWARAEFERLVALGDPVIFIGDWNVDHATLVAAMGPLATVDGGSPDMIVYANCRKIGSENLGKDGSDHYAKRWDLEA